MKLIIKVLSSPYLWLAIILVFGWWVRMYKIDNPIADWHSWRQADTAAVARNFYQDGYTPFMPKGDDMSTVNESFLPNPNRLRMVEFPIYPTIVYWGYLINGGVDEQIARQVSAAFSLGSIVMVWLIAKRYFGKPTAMLAAGLMAFLPYNIYYSRTTLPEPSLVFFSLSAFYLIDRWIRENRWWQFGVGLVMAILALLTKPTAGFYWLPLLYVYWQQEKKIIPPWRYWLFGVLALLPFAAWRYQVSLYPEGVPNARWLFNGDGIRFKPAYWRWILDDRFRREILSVVGFVFLIVGLLKKVNPKEGWVMHLFALSAGLYLAVFATGNVTHDYYQYLIIPAVAIFTARGITTLIGGINDFIPRIYILPMVALFFSLMFYLTWFEVKGLYQVNNGPMVEAGIEADKILPKEAVVLAPYGRDSAFLYQTNRNGFAVADYPIADMATKMGVTHLVSLTLDAKTKWAIEKYQVVEQTPHFVIVDLRNAKPNFETPEP